MKITETSRKLMKIIESSRKLRKMLKVYENNDDYQEI